MPIIDPSVDKTPVLSFNRHSIIELQQPDSYFLCRSKPGITPAHRNSSKVGTLYDECACTKGNFQSASFASWQDQGTPQPNVRNLVIVLNTINGGFPAGIICGVKCSPGERPNIITDMGLQRTNCMLSTQGIAKVRMIISKKPKSRVNVKKPALAQ